MMKITMVRMPTSTLSLAVMELGCTGLMVVLEEEQGKMPVIPVLLGVMVVQDLQLLPPQPSLFSTEEPVGRVVGLEVVVPWGIMAEAVVEAILVEVEEGEEVAVEVSSNLRAQITSENLVTMDLAWSK